MKYWAYVDNEILGPYEKEKLIQLPGFTPAILICPQTPVGEKTGEWREASTFPELVALLNIPSGQSLKESGGIKPAQAAPAPESQPAPAEHQAGTPVDQEPKKISPLTPKSLTPLSLQGDDKQTAEPQQRDEMHEMRKIAGGSFDPLTLSQIGRRFAEVKDDKPAPVPEDFSLSKPFFKQHQAPEPAAPAPESAPTPEPAAPTPESAPTPEPAAPTPEQAPTPTPELAPQQIEQVAQPPKPEAPQPSPQPSLPANIPVEQPRSPVGVSHSGIDPMTLSQVNRNLQDVINSGILKQDFPEQIKFILQKVGHIEEFISIMQKSQFQKEIFDKIGRLENSINEIKTNLAAKPETKEPPAPQKIEVKPASVSPAPVQAAPKKEEVPPPQPKVPEKKEEIQDQGEKTKTSVAGNIVKKFLKLVMILVLICGVLAVGVFVLKQIGVIDLTNIIDIPFISKSRKTETPQQPVTETKPEEKFSQEAVNMVREYLLKPGGDKLEIIINKAANKLQTDINFGEWKTVRISPDVYNVTISMPYNNGQSKLIYGFEVDFKNKIVKHLDEETKKLFESDIPPQQVTQQEKIQKPGLKQPRKGRRGRTPQTQQVQPQKQVQQKPAQKPKQEDEEYEYVYEDETSAGDGTEEVVEEEPAEDEYMVPGVPKKQ